MHASGRAGTLLPYYLKEEHEWGLDLQELHDQTEKVCTPCACPRLRACLCRHCSFYTGEAPCHIEAAK